jgi:hypothetical protein
VLRDVHYRQNDPVVQHVVIRRKEGLPKKRDEPWFLMTNLRCDAMALTTLHEKRMTVEGLFCDDQNQRNAFALRRTQITKPERIDRLLPILVLAYWLLCGTGLFARQRYLPRTWGGSNWEKECSVFTVGRIMRPHREVAPAGALAAVVAAAPNRR